MSFRVIAFDAGEEMTSSAMTSKEDALDFAGDLRSAGLEILRIISRTGEVVADAAEIDHWCKTAPPARGRPGYRQ